MATKIEQAGRPLQVKTPLDNQDELVPMRLAGSEGLSRPFRYLADFLSPTAGLSAAKLLGKGLGFQVFAAPNTTRLIHGRVSHWAELGLAGTSGLTHYRAEVVPGFWLLELSSDCRTFENRTVREIVEAIFTANKFVDFKFDLMAGTPKVAYVVQYQESDFAFVSRMLQEHGLHYTFEHQTGKEILVITDRVASLVPAGVTASLPISPFTRKGSPVPNIPGVGPPGKAAGDAAGAAAGAAIGSLLGPFGTVGGGLAGGLIGGAVTSIVDGLLERIFGSGDKPPQNAVIELLRERRVHTKTMSARDFHLLRAADTASETSGDPAVSGEHFEFLGDLSGTAAAGVAKATAKLRIEGEETARELFRGGSTASTLIPGTRVKVTGGILGAAGNELHVLEVAHVVDAGNLLTGDKNELKYINEFIGMPVGTPYRPERTVPRPSVRGTQTAEVVGDGGAGAIDVDADGCVLLKFPWDRGDGKDGKSKHRVHVASVWSGVGWGEVHLPRLGQLVLVEFLEGDPDRPIVTGRVYSRNHAHPYTLPANKTQSGIKSRSLGGEDTNFNELRFEDKKGEEHVFLQAEKDLQVKVKASETRTVGGDSTTTIQRHHTMTIKEGDQRIEVEKGNQEVLTREGDQTLAVKSGKQFIATLGGDQIFKATGDQRTRVEKGDRVINVEDGSNTLTVKTGALTLRALNDDVTLRADIGDLTVRTDAGNMSIKADSGKIKIEAGTMIEIGVGSNSIKISASGITIQGATVKVAAVGAAEIQGAVVRMEGQAMLNLKSPMAQMNGDGMLMVKGGVTMIN